MPTRIETLEHGAPGFFDLLGPFFCSREVQRELGGPIYSDPRHRWIVVRAGSEVVAWRAVIVEPERLTLEWAWVAPEWRRRGLYRQMEAEALGMAEGLEVRSSTAHDWLKRRWEAMGFVRLRHRGRWTYYTRPPEET